MALLDGDCHFPSVVHDSDRRFSLFLVVDPYGPFQRVALRCHQEIEIDNAPGFAIGALMNGQLVPRWQFCFKSAQLPHLFCLSGRWTCITTSKVHSDAGLRLTEWQIHLFS
jgi:hypothetical protein